MAMYKMILIDDNPLGLEMLIQAINWYDYGVTIIASFTDSVAALEYIKLNHVDIICSDIKMPNLSGIELAEICQRDYPSIEFVLISAFSEFEYARQAIKYNVSAYLTKPLVYNDVVNMITAVTAKLDLSKTQNNGFANSDVRILFQKKTCRVVIPKQY